MKPGSQRLIIGGIESCRTSEVDECFAPSFLEAQNMAEVAMHPRKMRVESECPLIARHRLIQPILRLQCAAEVVMDHRIIRRERERPFTLAIPSAPLPRSYSNTPRLL